MALEVMTRTKRRWLHFISGDLHPNVVARATRELKRGHRRLVRRQWRQRLRTVVIDS